MKILLDNCVVKRFGPLLTGHETTHASQIGWSKLENGDLIRAAEESGFEVMITVDKNLQYQQSLVGRQISIIVLSPVFVYYENIAALVPEVIVALQDLAPGSFLTIRPSRRVGRLTCTSSRTALDKRPNLREYFLLVEFVCRKTCKQDRHHPRGQAVSNPI